MSFFRKSGPSPEELARENGVKKSITENFKMAVKLLQQEFVVSDEPIHSEDTANAVCNVLEAVFLHGLKDSFSTRAFWSFLQKFTHKDVVSQLNHLGQITTEVGMCRAWIRLALNDGVLESYLDAMLADGNTLKYYYKRFAYLRDLEHPGILKTYIQGIGNFTFQLSYNSSVLNIWTTTPLILAGLQEGSYTPPAVVHPRKESSRHTPIATRSSPASKASPNSNKPSRMGRRRGKHHRSGARVVSPMGQNGAPRLPTVPQNTPIDPSELTSQDIDEIRKLTLLHKRSDDESSTATSLISHPDPVDARQNFSLPFGSSPRGIQSLHNSSLPSDTFIQEGKLEPPVSNSHSSQDTIGQARSMPAVSIEDNLETVLSREDIQDQCLDRNTESVLETMKDEGYVPEQNSNDLTSGDKPTENNNTSLPLLIPNLVAFDKGVQEFNDRPDSVTLTLTPEGQGHNGSSPSPKAQSSQLGSSPGRIKSLFPVIHDLADDKKLEDEPAMQTVSEDDANVAAAEETGNAKQEVTSERDKRSSTSSSLLEFSPVRRKSEPLDPEMSTVTADPDIKRRKDSFSKEQDSASDLEQPPDLFNPELSRTPAEVRGNSLGMMEGWSSSPFEEKTDAVALEGETEAVLDGTSALLDHERLHLSMGDESFNQLLQSYGPSATPLDAPSMSQVLDALPESEREKRRFSSPPVTQPSTRTTDLEEDVFDEYEVLPDIDEINSMPDDPNTQAFLEVFGDICAEKGLDFQNYQCKACGRPVGMFYGKARVCTYDACYYCYSCHENDEYYVPARILYNWDFRKHRVSKQSHVLLKQHEERPLLNVENLNPRLYDHVKEMQDVLLLRQQLCYLKAYLFSCKHSIADDLRRQVWPREYLYDDIHLYSLSDLLQVPTGTLAQSIRKALKFATKHVYSCRLCCQKGFICEICNNPKVIYPFEMDTTSRCEQCKAVYHKECKTDSKTCPKCERRRQRRGTLGNDVNETVTDGLDYAISPDSGLQLSDTST